MVDTIVPVRSIVPPVAVADVASTVAFATVTVSAAVTVTQPPLPSLAFAFTAAPLSRVTLRPDTSMRPPFCWPLVDNLPVTLTLPPSPPPSTIAPSRPDTERAATTPDTFTASRIASRTVAALSSTRPPDALMRPPAFTSAPSVSEPVGTATCRKPLP